MKNLIKLTMVFFLVVPAFAHPTYTGYSGAPGCRGTCTSSCHAEHDFSPSITVTGFPESYVPGQQYVIAVGHSSGTTIRNFNSSIRIGTGNANAGTITAGTRTSVYSANGESNGVHFSSPIQSSGTFNWTAPIAGTGDVRLYWAGLQGSYTNGADTHMVIISHEAITGIEDSPNLPNGLALNQNYPNPFNGETNIEFSIDKPGKVDFYITNIMGQMVYVWNQYVSNPGMVSLHWNGKDANGKELPSGVYLYQLVTSDRKLSRKMVMMK